MKRQTGWAAGKRRRRWVRTVLLIVVLLVFILPLAWTFVASLGILPDDTSSPPVWLGKPTFQNYLYIGIAEPGFLGEIETNVSVALFATLLTSVISFLSAYSLARARAPIIRTGIQGFLILASLPVMAYIIPLSDVIRRLRLYDTFVGIALANTAIFAPLAVYILYGYLRQQTPDLEESARLDGGSLVQILWHIVAPDAAPGIAATALILFVLNWNLLLVPLVLTENHVRTIPVAMSDFFTFERDLEWPVAAAVLISSLAPLLILVAAAHRLLERFSLRPEKT